MSMTYTKAIEQLENNYKKAEQQGITGSNKYEAYLVGKGVLPTSDELHGTQEFAYDWFMAVYYNRPELLAQLDDETAVDIIDAAIYHAADDDDMREFIAMHLASAAQKGPGEKTTRPSESKAF